MAVLTVTLHLAALMVNIPYFIYDFLNTPDPNPGYGGKAKYLTQITFYLHTVYHALAIGSQVYGGQLRKIRDTFHASLAFPLAVMVPLLFWGLYFYDRDLVQPPAMDDVYPSCHNLVVHLLCLPILLIEKVLVHHVYPSVASGISWTLLFMSAYSSWIIFAGLHGNLWIYGVLRVLDWKGRAAFIGVAWILSLIFYFVGGFLTTCIWGVKKRARTGKLD